ncbi:MAG: aldo/keto reductase [Candidatus Omnitrophota bacterium]
MNHPNTEKNITPFNPSGISRRQFLKYAFYLTATGIVCPFLPDLGWTDTDDLLTKIIPRTNERIPVIGMGTWQTFHVGKDETLRNARTEVLRTFFDMGGTVIDSSPMYGTSEEVIGYALGRLDHKKSLFSATKIWTPFKAQGLYQLRGSHSLWGLNRFDLVQIHNLVAWQDHLELLLEWKKQGLVRYIGITTSHGRLHEQFEKVMTSAPIDFVQFTYNVLDREAEQRLLPIAAERKLGVIINRPFQGGQLFPLFAKHPLPEWAGEFGARTWSQFFLKFIVSHPAVTCTIPATSRIDHMKENMAALAGRLPTEPERKKMAEYITQL